MRPRWTVRAPGCLRRAPRTGSIAGIAADIPFTPIGAIDQRGLAGQIRSLLDGRPVDVVVQPVAHRRKRLFLADMDSTMIGQECIDELADYAGLKTHVAAITERAMRGEIAFEPALRERVALLKGLPQSVIDETIEKRIVLTPGGRTLVATMRANGAYTCLVSGGFTPFTSRVGAMIGFDEDRANTLLVESNGRLSGFVGEPILGREAKLDTLNELRQRFGLVTRRHDGHRRRRQRHPDDRSGRTRRRLSRQARGGAGGGRANRSRRSHRAALCAGLFARGIRHPITKKGGLCGRPSDSFDGRAYSIGRATNSMSPSAVATSRSAVFFPAFFKASTFFCTSPGAAICSCSIATIVLPAVSRLSAATEPPSTPVITTPLIESLILYFLRTSSYMPES